VTGMDKYCCLSLRLFVFLCGCGLAVATARAEISVRDDAGRTITLRAPARHIVSLAPHVTELFFAAGAGNALVGAVEYSDYPEAAKRLPRVGSGAGLDLEAIAALHPDLIVSWQSGNPPWQVDRLIKLGFPVFVTEPRHIDDIPDLLERMGRLAGTAEVADQAAAEFHRHEATLRDRYAGRRIVPVFYQVLDTSLYTVGGHHLISDVIELCGGENVFAALPLLAPRVDVESVLQKNPEVILASGYEPLWPEWRDRWHNWPMLTAVAQGNLFLIPTDLIERQGPRILQGAEQVCVRLDQARKKTGLSGNR
jgi:iron complex transport system substrate-binding protein